MSVVVRMEMPKGCLDCPCVNGEYGYCQADKEERQIEDPNGRPSWCPIICSFTGEEESQSPKPTDPVPIRDVYYVMTECDAKTGTVKYEPRERIEL